MKSKIINRIRERERKVSERMASQLELERKIAAIQAWRESPKKWQIVEKEAYREDPDIMQRY